jgi:hypothetical protein
MPSGNPAVVGSKNGSGIESKSLSENLRREKSEVLRFPVDSQLVEKSCRLSSCRLLKISHFVNFQFVDCQIVDCQIVDCQIVDCQIVDCQIVDNAKLTVDSLEVDDNFVGELEIDIDT